jgi:endonuclease III
VIATLREFYGLLATPPADLFQFFVWEIVSENALPARRDHAWQMLRRLPALTPDAMFRAPAKDVLDAIGTAGPHREEKLERIRAVVGDFKRHRDLLRAETLARMRLMAVTRSLSRIEVVSRAARGRALLFALGRLVLPIDQEIHRVIARLASASASERRPAVRRRLASRLDPDPAAYRDAVTYLRHHAQHTCTRVAPHCGVCPLRHGCEFGRSVQRSNTPA